MIKAGIYEIAKRYSFKMLFALMNADSVQAPTEIVEGVGDIKKLAMSFRE